MLMMLMMANVFLLSFATFLEYIITSLSLGSPRSQHRTNQTPESPIGIAVYLGIPDLRLLSPLHRGIASFCVYMYLTSP